MLPMIACLNGSYNNSATITGFYIRSDHSMKLLVRMKGQKNAEWNELQDARSLINKGSLYALGEIKHRQFSLLAAYKIRFWILNYSWGHGGHRSRLSRSLPLRRRGFWNNCCFIFLNNSADERGCLKNFVFLILFSVQSKTDQLPVNYTSALCRKKRM